MAGLETSVMLQFARRMDRAAWERNLIVHPFPLNAQDRDAAGDIIFSDEARLALVELKSFETNLADEGRKPRRRVLCQKLLNEPEMIELHDRAHFAAWLADTSIQLNIYRHEICAQTIFPGERSLPESPDFGGRFRVDDYASLFFDTTSVSLPLEDFKRYLEWVMIETSGSERSTVRVQAVDDEKREFHMLQFDSLDAAHDWFNSHGPKNGNIGGISGPEK